MIPVVTLVAGSIARVSGRDPFDVLTTGVADVVPEEGLRELLASGRTLRAKLGIDPSRPDLHLGHAVVLRTLRRFQDLGHQAVLIIGDFTGRVGDPSGQSETRPLLSEDEIDANSKTYLEQAALVVDIERAEVRRNSEWLATMDMGDVLRLASTYTVARMLERDDFQQRQRAGQPITVVEFLYPLLQAMDSVQISADVELGGTDQLFNLLVGREIQRAYGQNPQVALTMPLLEGTDGRRKMSKSFDNYVGLTEPADDMFGKLMRVPDELVVKYLRLCTDLDLDELDRVESDLASGSLRPDVAKRRLAAAVVDLYQGAGEGTAAERRFDRVHREHELPEEIAEAPVPAEAIRQEGVWVPGMLAALGLASSNSEARRLIEQGGVRLDGTPLDDPDRELALEDLRGRVLQVGRRRFVRLR